MTHKKGEKFSISLVFGTRTKDSNYAFMDDIEAERRAIESLERHQAAFACLIYGTMGSCQLIKRDQQ